MWTNAAARCAGCMLPVLEFPDIFKRSWASGMLAYLELGNNVIASDIFLADQLQLCEDYIKDD